MAPMKNQFFALVLGLLTLSAMEAQCSMSLEEVNAPAVTAELPTGGALPYLLNAIDLHPAVCIDIEAGEAPKAPVSIGSVLAGYTSELAKPPSNSFVRPAYRSWLR